MAILRHADFSITITRPLGFGANSSRSTPLGSTVQGAPPAIRARVRARASATTPTAAARRTVQRASHRVVTEEVGRPDGAATDEQGYYWSAGISAGVLNRWAPDGSLDRSVPLPCARPTAPCFGGPDLRTVFVTSLRHDLPADVLTASPLSGGIFALRVDVPGVPVGRFAG